MKVLITAKRAIFTRPELKVEKYSYEVPTPSALCGVLKSVYWKPEMEYVIDQITVLNEIKYQEVMTNGQIIGATALYPVSRKEAATPKSMNILTDVAYVVDFHVILTGKGTHTNDVVEKHVAIFYQRLQKGQQFRTPNLGCKEFVCELYDAAQEEIPQSYYNGTSISLGVMLHHIEYDNKRGNRQIWYRPVMKDGVINCHESSDSGGGWLFEQLIYYYEKNVKKYHLPVPGFSFEKVYYELTIDLEGNPVGFTPLNTTQKGKIAPVILEVPEQVLGRTSSIKANFAYDNEKYVLGIDKKDTDGCLKRKTFFEKLKDVTKGINNKEVKAILAFFEKDKAAVLPFIKPYQDKDGKLSGNIVFRIKGEDHYFHDNPEIRDAWSKYYKNHADGERITCMLTGRQDAAAKIHPLIKGVSGASAFAKLISVEKNSFGFMSYGWQGLENTPMGKEATYKYSTALNYLLSQLPHRVSVGKSTFVFWTMEDVPELLEYLRYLISGYQNDEIKIDAIPEGEQFYILELKANASRLYIKRYESFTWGEKGLIRRLIHYIHDTPVIDRKKSWDAINIFDKEAILGMEKTQGYYLGELLALCEKAQRDAVPSTRGTKTMADKYMTTACSTPAKVFPRLLIKTQQHLNKVNYGMRAKIQNQMEILMQFPEAFPVRLGNQEQCNFLAGYNVKNKELYTKKVLDEPSSEKEQE